MRFRLPHLPVLVVALPLSACASALEHRDSTEILRDEWLLPHIFAHDSETLFYAHERHLEEREVVP